MSDARVSRGLDGRVTALTRALASSLLLVAVAGCESETPAGNECGGSRALSARVGDACGPCGDGVYQCTVDGDVGCVGASANNVCGGCSVLPEAPGTDCTGDEGPGKWRCDGVDSVSCVPSGPGACGGVVDPDPLPGQPCGACDLGRTVCDGPDTTICIVDLSVINSCGSCGDLGAAAPGDPCGECGGRLVCYEGGLVCHEAGRNRCGGCGGLEGDPGSPCDGGVFVCTPTGEVVCQPEGTNACGGQSTLDDEPGKPCGGCGDGWTVCASPDLVVCSGASETNVCGGCGPLPGVPGEICAGEGWAWTCTVNGTLSCVESRPPGVVAVHVRPATLKLEKGETGKLEAFAELEDGTEIDVTASAQWSSDQPERVGVSAGQVTAVGSGFVDVRASYEGKEGVAKIEVPGPPVSALKLSPDMSLTLTIGVCVPFEAIATLISGEEVTVTGEATWSVFGEGLTASGPAGRYCVVAAGGATVQAEFGGQTASVHVSTVAGPSHVVAAEDRSFLHRTLYPTAHVAAQSDPHHYLHRTAYPSTHVSSDPRTHNVTRP